MKNTIENDNNENPWSVSNLNEFLYFCCPECDLKDHSKEHFLQHALNEHPKAKNWVQKFHEIKEEPFKVKEKDENLFNEYYVKCELKEDDCDNEVFQTNDDEQE